MIAGTAVQNQNLYWFTGNAADTDTPAYVAAPVLGSCGTPVAAVRVMAKPPTVLRRVELHGSDLRPGLVVTFGNVGDIDARDAELVEWLREDLVAVQTPAHAVGTAMQVELERADGQATLAKLQFRC